MNTYTPESINRPDTYNVGGKDYKVEGYIKVNDTETGEQFFVNGDALGGVSTHTGDAIKDNDNLDALGRVLLCLNNQAFKLLTALDLCSCIGLLDDDSIRIRGPDVSNLAFNALLLLTNSAIAVFLNLTHSRVPFSIKNIVR